MLTRAQIQRVAQHHGIGMQAQERDYIQHLLLFLLYKRSQRLIFKGGTALRVVYRGNRYSEDLDFNGPPDVDFLGSIWNSVVAELVIFGVIAELRNTWTSDVGYSTDVSYQGPLYDGRARSKGKLRVDLNRRPESVETRRVLVTPEYDDLRPFVVTVLTPEHLLAEKVRALLVRSKPRDVYDIWLMTNQGVKLDRELISAKLTLYGLVLKKDSLEAAVDRAHADWERDLRPLLPQFITWDEVIPSLEPLREQL